MDKYDCKKRGCCIKDGDGELWLSENLGAIATADLMLHAWNWSVRLTALGAPSAVPAGSRVGLRYPFV